jgi:hypothetical protein
MAVPLRQVLAEDFPRDCTGLPIAGGWGYSQSEAITFVRGKFPNQASPDFVSLEYHIAQKIIYEELIICRATKGDQFSGITLKLERQRTSVLGGKTYDCLKFGVSCWHDWHWEQLKAEWELNDFGIRPGFDQAAHAAKREAARVTYERELWFDITDVFGGPEVRR